MSDTNTSTVANTRTDRKVRHLPQYRVILENDDVNDGEVVVRRIVEFTSLESQEAVEKTIEAHETGRSLLLVTHLEKAEWIQEQFHSCSPSISIALEPEE